LQACSFILFATIKITWPNKFIHPLTLARDVSHQSRIKESIVSQVKIFPQVISWAAGIAQKHKDPPMKSQGISRDQPGTITELTK